MLLFVINKTFLEHIIDRVFTILKEILFVSTSDIIIYHAAQIVLSIRLSVSFTSLWAHEIWLKTFSLKTGQWLSVASLKTFTARTYFGYVTPSIRKG